MAKVIVKVQLQKFFTYEASSEAEAIAKAKSENLSEHLKYKIHNSPDIPAESEVTEEIVTGLTKPSDDSAAD